MAVRPCIVYGPYDYTERLDYWIDRVLSQDHVVVPGDGQNLWHRAYVEDVASGLRIVAERGEAGAAYNVGDRQALTLAETLETIADAAGTDCEVVTASADALAAGGLEPERLRVVPGVPASARHVRARRPRVGVDTRRRGDGADRRRTSRCRPRRE